MGKAKRQLLAARESCYDTIKEIESDDEEKDKEYIKEKEYYLLDTVFILRDNLMKYTDDCVIPLCEYLDINNVENYLNWVVKHG